MRRGTNLTVLIVSMEVNVLPDVATPKQRRLSPKTWISVGIVAAVLTGLIVVASNAKVGSPKSSLVGTRVASFSLPGLDSGTEKAPWAGGHPGVLIFFASWCIPCRGEMPKVAAYISTHPPRGVTVMGIDSNDAQSLAQTFTRNDHVTFPVAFDASNAVTAGIFKFGQIPETVFVDGSGIVKQVYYGAIPVRQLSSGIVALRQR